MSDRFEQLRASDQQHHWHPFTDHKELGEVGGSRIVTRADGVYIYDSTGLKILDGMAGLWCVNVGYGRDELVDAAAGPDARAALLQLLFPVRTPAFLRVVGENFVGGAGGE